MTVTEPKTSVYDDVTDLRALSLLQPWLDAVLDGKPVENRLKWTNSHFRGPVLLHASKRGKATRVEYVAATKFVAERGLAWRPRSYDGLQCGGILGRANVVGVVRATAKWLDRGVVKLADGTERGLTATERIWWMGGFALVLADVERLPFVPCRGAQGFWRVSADVAAKVGMARRAAGEDVRG